MASTTEVRLLMWVGEFLGYDISAPWPQQVSNNSGHAPGLGRVAGAVYALDTSDSCEINRGVYISRPGMTKANQCIILHSPLLRSPAHDPAAVWVKTPLGVMKNGTCCGQHTNHLTLCRKNDVPTKKSAVLVLRY